MLAVSTLTRNGSACLSIYHLSSLPGRKHNELFFSRKTLTADPCNGFVSRFEVSALRKSEKKLTSDKKTSKTKYLQRRSVPLQDEEENSDVSPTKDEGSYNISASSNLDSNNAIPSPTRSAVLQACIFTSGFLLLLGVVLRQVCHVASMERWQILDASTEVSFDFEMWHITLTIGLVMLISSCRYILLKTWPDFSESSEAANQQVLSSLQPLDYLVIAFLPGISEELLFRGALLPLFGLNWISALVIGTIFGSLHLGSGRRYSFAIWATLVGFAYGLATIFSSSVIVPIASHSLNNLIGAILWRVRSVPEEI